MFEVEKESYLGMLKNFRLDEGEALVYGLFKKERGKAILTDDKELIKLCRIEGIPFISAMAIVVRSL